LRHIGLRDFGTELDNAAKAVFPNNKKSRYSRVHVLLISWETQDPKLPVQKEISNLHEFPTRTVISKSAKRSILSSRSVITAAMISRSYTTLVTVDSLEPRNWRGIRK
jgi:hypothetical protein